MTDNTLEQEYPYTVIGFEFTEKEYHRHRIYQNLLNSLPNNVTWYKSGLSSMDHVLSSQYNAIIVSGCFRFKTEADRTMFLLRFG
jgi:hypothetical protein